MKEKRKRLLRKLAYFPMLIMMAMIFIFSADNGDESSEKSDTIAEYVWDIAENFHVTVSNNTKAEWNDTIIFVIRKVAHMTEYAILSVLIFLGIRIDTGNKPKWYWVIGIGIFYAATDEIHQLFVPGRSGHLRDVCIDGVGVAIGFFIMNLICRGKRNIPGE